MICNLYFFKQIALQKENEVYIATEINKMRSVAQFLMINIFYSIKKININM